MRERQEQRVRDGTAVQSYMEGDLIEKIDRLGYPYTWSRAETVRRIVRSFHGTSEDLVKALPNAEEDVRGRAR